MIEEVAEFTPAMRAEIVAGEADPFGVGDLVLRWRPKDVHLVMRDADGRLIGHAGLVEVDVEVDGEAFRAAGVGSVILNRDRRAQGRLRPLLEATLRRADAFGHDHALLLCLPRRTPMYAHLGFRAIAGPVTADQPDGPLVLPVAAMWVPLFAGAEWPDGPVRLRGSPF